MSAECSPKNFCVFAGRMKVTTLSASLSMNIFKLIFNIAKLKYSSIFRQLSRTLSRISAQINSGQVPPTVPPSQLLGMVTSMVVSWFDMGTLHRVA